ncbi:MAG: hypothetical protein QM687_13690 [Ferruginibacter sp.]
MIISRSLLIKIGAMLLITALLYPQLQYNGAKPKKDFTRITGTVLSVTNTHERYEGLDTARFRYISISGFNPPFKVFVGKGKWDFVPVLDKIDALKRGDTVTAYCVSNIFTNNEVNAKLYYLDRGEEAIYIQGISANKKYLVNGLTVFVLGFIFFLMYREWRLRKKVVH